MFFSNFKGPVQHDMLCTVTQHWTTNFKKIFVPVMNMLFIYLFASMKLEKEYKKNTWL